MGCRNGCGLVSLYRLGKMHQDLKDSLCHFYAHVNYSCVNLALPMRVLKSEIHGSNPD